MAVQDLGIYFNSGNETVFRYHFSRLASYSSENWSYYLDADSFNNSKHQRRVACFHIPFPYTDQIDREIDAIYDQADTIIILGSELHPRIVDFMRRYNRPKMCWFVCGAIIDGLNGRTFNFMDWFITTAHFYKVVRPSILFDLNPYTPKPLMFDALLGRKKPHRDQAYEFINSNLPAQGILTYINNHQINFNATDKSSWIWPTGALSEHEGIEWTVDRVNYYGYKMSISQIIPIEVYNQTAYTLVCETNFDNDYVFFTEKTVKPIIGRRLFVMVGHRYAMRQLQHMGFKTFNGIIDESYDEIENPRERHAAALEQLRWLCNQDQQTILNQVKEIADYNFNHMMGYDWYGEFSGPLGRILLKN